MVLPTALALLLCSTSLRAEEDWNRVFERGRQLAASGKLREARQSYLQALQLAGPSDPPHMLHRLKNALASLHITLGEDSQAELLLRSIASELPPSDSANLGTVKENLAHALHNQGRLLEAERICREALLLLEQSFGAGHPAHATASLALGSILHDLGNTKEAEQRYAEALRIAGSGSPAMTDVRLQAATNLGTIHMDASRFSEAKAVFQEVLAIREKTLPSWHPDLAITIQNLGMAQYMMGEGQAAEALLRRALSARLHHIEPAHPTVLQLQLCLATVLLRLSRFDEAAQILHQALAASANATSNPHPVRLQILTQLGSLYIQQGDYHRADSVLQQALTVAARTLGPHHWQVGFIANYQCRASLHLGRLAAAETQCSQAMKIFETQTGSSKSGTAQVLANLGQLSYLRKQYAHALEQHQRAFAQFQENPTLDQRQLADVLRAMALDHVALKQYAQAEQCLRRASAIYESRPGLEASLRETLEAHAQVLRKLSRKVEARQQVERARILPHSVR